MPGRKRLVLIIVFISTALLGCTRAIEVYVPAAEPVSKYDILGTRLETPPEFGAVVTLLPEKQHLLLELLFSLRDGSNVQFESAQVTLEVLPEQALHSAQFPHLRDDNGKPHDTLSVISSTYRPILNLDARTNFSTDRPARVRLHLPPYRLNDVRYEFAPIELVLGRKVYFSRL